MEREKIVIVDEDVAGGEVGIIGFMPSGRHLALVADREHADRLKDRFREAFGISLEEDYLSKLIGDRLGVIAMPFFDRGIVCSSEDVMEVSSMKEARAAIPQIRLEDDPDHPDRGGRAR